MKRIIGVWGGRRELREGIGKGIEEAKRDRVKIMLMRV